MIAIPANDVVIRGNLLHLTSKGKWSARTAEIRGGFLMLYTQGTEKKVGHVFIPQATNVDLIGNMTDDVGGYQFDIVIDPEQKKCFSLRSQDIIETAKWVDKISSLIGKNIDISNTLLSTEKRIETTVTDTKKRQISDEINTPYVDQLQSRMTFDKENLSLDKNYINMIAQSSAAPSSSSTTATTTMNNIKAAATRNESNIANIDKKLIEKAEEAAMKAEKEALRLRMEKIRIENEANEREKTRILMQEKKIEDEKKEKIRLELENKIKEQETIRINRENEAKKALIETNRLKNILNNQDEDKNEQMKIEAALAKKKLADEEYAKLVKTSSSSVSSSLSTGTSLYGTINHAIVCILLLIIAVISYKMYPASAAFESAATSSPTVASNAGASIPTPVTASNKLHISNNDIFFSDSLGYERINRDTVITSKKNNVYIQQIIREGKVTDSVPSTAAEAATTTVNEEASGNTLIETSTSAVKYTTDGVLIDKSFHSIIASAIMKTITLPFRLIRSFIQLFR